MSYDIYYVPVEVARGGAVDAHLEAEMALDGGCQLPGAAEVARALMGLDPAPEVFPDGFLRGEAVPAGLELSWDGAALQVGFYPQSMAVSVSGWNAEAEHLLGRVRAVIRASGAVGEYDPQEGEVWVP